MKRVPSKVIKKNTNYAEKNYLNKNIYTNFKCSSASTFVDRISNAKYLEKLITVITSGSDSELEEKLQHPKVSAATLGKRPGAFIVANNK